MEHSQLVTLIEGMKGCSFVSMRTITKQTLLKAGKKVTAQMVEETGINPNDITKHTDLVCLVSGDKVHYEDFVNNKLLKEGKGQLTFSAKERKWGEHYNGNPALVTHNGNFYLVVYCVANNKPKVAYRHNGELIDIKDAKFNEFRTAPKKEGENQGLENPIVVRDYGFQSIKEITILGNTYDLVPDAE